ncbi:hypothetical protein CRU99_13730 [Malaciobacter mytili]|nr:hypothetical protein CRU99_13730 [Malaciobacter mytili]
MLLLSIGFSKEFVNTPEELLNQYFTIAEKAFRNENDDYDKDSVKAMMKLLLKPSERYAMIKISHFKTMEAQAKSDNKLYKKNLLDLSKRVYIHGIRENRQFGGIYLDYTYFAYEHPSYKKPKGVRYIANNPGTIPMGAKKVNGKYKWFIK